MSDLFWYPDRKYKDGEYDKLGSLQSYIRYYMARLQSMFKYENLPDTLPQKYLEHYLLHNGHCIIAKDDEDRIVAYAGRPGTLMNVYYIPCGYQVANPYFNRGLIVTDESNASESKMFKIGTDCEIIYNDTYAQGLLPMLNRYCRALVENDITLDIADILARATINISAADDKTKKSAELYLSRLREGKLGVIETNAFIEGLNITEFSQVANSITNLIEYHQYIKASLYNELGLNSNYNMKRESINSNESQLNDDMLHPLIDDMLRERQQGIDRINKMFDLDIKVTFNSSWEANEKEEDAIHTTMQAEAIAAEEAVIIPLIETEEEEVTNDEDTINVDSDTTDSVDTMDDVEVNEDEDISVDTTSDVSASDDIPDSTGYEEITEEDVEKASDIIEKIEEVMDEVEDKVDEEEEVEDDGTKDD